MPPTLDGAVGHSFALEVDGVAITNIMQVDGLKLEQDVIEYKHNSIEGKYFIQQLPGRRKAPKITLTRALTENKGFEDWCKKSGLGKVASARTKATIKVLDTSGLATVRSYTLLDAWASALEISSLKAGDTSVVTEKLTVVCNDFTIDDQAPPVAPA
jgi:phage tail-like protein